MTMTPAERQSHHVVQDRFFGQSCFRCRIKWPCREEQHRLLELEVEDLRAKLRKYEAEA